MACITFLVPPFGQEDLQDLQSIFEIAHLRKYGLFLDIQCEIYLCLMTLDSGIISFTLDRMPPQIGDIISEAVYENKLKSNPNHPITSEITACYFVNIAGKEKQCDKSFMASFLVYHFHFHMIK